MTTRSEIVLNCFIFGGKKHAIFSFHSFTGFALQGSVNVEFEVAAKGNFLVFDFDFELGIGDLSVCDHSCICVRGCSGNPPVFYGRLQRKTRPVGARPNAIYNLIYLVILLDSSIGFIAI